jgi:hypothetical protein
LILLTAAGCAGCHHELGQSAQAVPDSLVGTWVCVYPSTGFGDTLVLNADGSADGPASAVSDDNIQGVLRWYTDDPLQPGGVCFGDPARFVCSGYRLRGDTLALANGAQTVLIRAGSDALKLDERDSADVGSRERLGPPPPALRPPGGKTL